MVTIVDFLSLFATVRRYSRLLAIRAISTIRYSGLLAICYSGFPDSRCNSRFRSNKQHTLELNPENNSGLDELINYAIQTKEIQLLYTFKETKFQANYIPK